MKCSDFLSLSIRARGASPAIKTKERRFMDRDSKTTDFTDFTYRTAVPGTKTTAFTALGFVAPPAQGKHAKHAAAPVAYAALGKERDETGAECRQASGRVRAAQNALRTRQAALAEVATCIRDAAARVLNGKATQADERALSGAVLGMHDDLCRQLAGSNRSAPKRRQLSHLGLKMGKFRAPPRA